MTPESMWALIIALGAIAVGAVLHAVESGRKLHLSDEELSSSRKQINVLKKNHDQAISDLKIVHCAEVQKLSKQIPTALHNERLEELREKILLLVSENPLLGTNQITTSFPGAEQRALFHLQELQKLKFIINNYVLGSDLMGTKPRAYTWSIGNKGLAYLNKYELLQ